MVGFCCALLLGLYGVGLAYDYEEPHYPGYNGLSETILNSMGDMWPNNQIKHDCATRHPNTINDWRDYYSKGGKENLISVDCYDYLNLDSSSSSEESDEQWQFPQQYPSKTPNYLKKPSEETHHESKSAWNILQQPVENYYEKKTSGPILPYGSSSHGMIPIRPSPNYGATNTADPVPFDRQFHDQYYSENSQEIPVNIKKGSENCPQNTETLLEKLLKSISDLLAKVVDVSIPMPCNGSDKTESSFREAKNSDENIKESATMQQDKVVFSSNTEMPVPLYTDKEIVPTEGAPSNTPISSDVTKFVPEYIKNIEILNRYAEKQANLLDVIKIKYNYLADRVISDSTTSTTTTTTTPTTPTTTAYRMLDVPTPKTNVDQSTTELINEQLETISSAEPEKTSQEFEISSELAINSTEITTDQSTTELTTENFDTSTLTDEEFSEEFSTTEANLASGFLTSVEPFLESHEAADFELSDEFIAATKSTLESTSISPEEITTTTESDLPTPTNRKYGPRMVPGKQRPTYIRNKRYASLVNRPKKIMNTTPKMDTELPISISSSESQSNFTEKSSSPSESAEHKVIIDNLVNDGPNPTNSTDQNADKEILNPNPIVEYSHAELLTKEKKHHLDAYPKRTHKCRRKPTTQKPTTPKSSNFDNSNDLVENPPSIIKPAGTETYNR